MQIIKGKDSFANICFYIGMLIHAAIMVVGYGDFEIPYVGRFLQAAFAFLCLKILMTYYTKKEWAVMVLLGLLGVFSYLCTRDEYVISVIVIIFAAKKADVSRFIKTLLWAALAGAVVTAVLSLCGIGGMAVDIRDYGRGGVEARWCLGFGHANNLHGTLWYLLALVSYIYYEKLNWKHYLLFSALNVGLFFLTISKAGLISAQMIIFAGMLFKYIAELKEQKWLYWLVGVALIFVQMISVVSAAVSIEGNKVLTLLDKIFTGRIQLAYKHAPLLQWNFLTKGGELGPVDNGWVVMYYNYGIAVGIVFVLFHCYMLYMSYKQKNGIFLAMLATSILYIFMEATYSVNVTYLLSNLTYITAMLMIGEMSHEST